MNLLLTVGAYTHKQPHFFFFFFINGGIHLLAWVKTSKWEGFHSKYIWQTSSLQIFSAEQLNPKWCSEGTNHSQLNVHITTRHCSIFFLEMHDRLRHSVPFGLCSDGGSGSSTDLESKPQTGSFASHSPLLPHPPTPIHLSPVNLLLLAAFKGNSTTKGYEDKTGGGGRWGGVELWTHSAYCVGILYFHAPPPPRCRRRCEVAALPVYFRFWLGWLNDASLCAAWIFITPDSEVFANQKAIACNIMSTDLQQTSITV